MRAIKPNMRRRSLVAHGAAGAGGDCRRRRGHRGRPGGLQGDRPGNWPSGERRKARSPRTGFAIPLSARPIPAYTTVTRDYLMNPKTAQWVLVYKPPESGAERGRHRDLENPRARHGTLRNPRATPSRNPTFCPWAPAPASWAARRKENAPSLWTPASSRAPMT